MYGNVGEVKVLKVERILVIYSVVCSITYTPNHIFLGSCPEMIPFLKADKDPAEIVNTLHSTRFIKKNICCSFCGRLLSVPEYC